MKNKLHNQILSALLALMVFFNCFPVTHAATEMTEVPETETADYSSHVGMNATFSEDFGSESFFAVLDAEPEADWDAISFCPTDFGDDILFRITAYKVVASAYEITHAENGEVIGEGTMYSLWYQVNVIGGTSNEDFADGYWILQNYLGDDAEEYDVLTLSASSEEPAMLVDPNGSGVTVTGAIPENAILKVSIPAVNGEPIPNIYDIKIYLEDGVTQWQPIDEGKTVTISIPVDAGKDCVSVTHFVDYANDINGDEQIVSAEGADDATLAILQPALDAYGDGIHVALEVTEKVTPVNGMVSIQTDSFSVYTPEYEKQEDNFTVSFTSSGSEDPANEKTYYATNGQTITFTFTYDGDFLGVNDQNGTYSLVRLSDNLSINIGNTTENKVWNGLSCEITESITISFSSDALGITLQPGDLFQVNWETGKSSGGKQPRWTRVMIVGEYDEEEDNVSFNANGGKWTIEGEDVTKLAQTIVSYQPVSHVPQPAREGYTFIGWDTAADGTGIRYAATDNFPAVVGNSTVFYAQWTSDTYTVTYVVPTAVTESGVFGTQQVAHGGSVTILQDKPVLEGYSFDGWDTDGDGNADIPVSEIEGYTLTNIKSEMTLIAVWTEPIYAIIYHANGGINAPPTQYLDTGNESSILLTESIPSCSGSQFFGWDANGDGVADYRPGDTYSEPSSVTLYALWQPYTYKIEFSGGSAGTVTGSTNATSCFTYNDFINLTANGFRCEIAGIDQTFQGWALTEGATAVLYSNGQNVRASDLIDRIEDMAGSGQLAEGTDENGVTYKIIPLHAVWATETYTIHYEANGGNIKNLTQTVICSNNSDVTIDNSCSQYGYTFAGWTTDADGTEPEYQNGGSVPPGTNGETITLYAIWYLNVAGYIGIRIGDNNITSIGKIITADGTVYENQRYVEPIEPGEKSPEMTFVCPEGYEIVEYYVRAELQDIKEGLNTYTYAGNEDVSVPFNVVAVIAPKTYTVTWKNADGTVLKTEENVTHGAVPVYDGETPTKAADAQYTYTFAGWDPAPAAITGEATYTATYTPTAVEYTITFDTDGGAEVAAITAAYNAPLTLPEAPSKTGYTFTGWHYDADKDDAVDEGELYEAGAAFTMPNENITLTAQWVNLVEYTIEYYLYNSADDNYTRKETEAGTGYIGDIVEITKAYTGYALKESGNLTIEAADQVIKVYYAPITYTVRFHTDGHVENQTMTYGKIEALRANTFSKSGFVFVGWAESANGVKIYDDCATVENLASEQDAVVELYALFAPLTLTISQTGIATGDSAVYQIATDGSTVLTVILTGEDSVTIEQIPAGTYTVTEISGNWTWTYGNTESQQVTISENEDNHITFTYGHNSSLWLHSETRSN